MTFWLSILPQVAEGLRWTVVLSVVSIAGALVVGFLGGALRAARVGGVDRVIGAYVEIFRNTPLLVQIFFLYFGLPEIGVRLSGFAVACLSLVLWGGAYNVENFRAGFDAVAHDYRSAARALALNEWQVFSCVVIPIGARIAVPSLINIAISILKNTSFMIVISFPEMTFTAYNIVSQSFRGIAVFSLVGAIYLALGWMLSLATRSYEQRAAARWSL